jgi:hypothetical protein
VKLMTWKVRYQQADPEAASSSAIAQVEEDNVSEGEAEAAPGETSFIDEMTNDFEGSEGETPTSADESPLPPNEPESEGAGSPPAQDAPPSPPSPEQPESAEAPPPPTQTPSQPEAQAPQATPPTQQEQQKPLSPEEQQAALAKHRQETIAQLNEHYKLDDDMAVELASDPATAIPKLFAQMHYDMTQALFSGVMSQIPSIVQQQTVEMQRASELENSFFGKYPGLKQHGEVVKQSLNVALNSQIANTYEEVEQLAVSMAAIKLGVPVEQLRGQAAAPMQQAAPRAPTPARPIAPGGTAGPMSPPTQQRGGSVWDDMVEFELNESSG